MYATKAIVFNYLSRNQKAYLCSFLRRFTKNCFEIEGLSTTGDVLDEFLQEEREIENFHFSAQYLEDEQFLKDLKLFIGATLKDLEYKKAQKPFIESQKARAKEIRKEMRKKRNEFSGA
jgi:hypothetical protein